MKVEKVSSPLSLACAFQLYVARDYGHKFHGRRRRMYVMRSWIQKETIRGKSCESNY